MKYIVMEEHDHEGFAKEFETEEEAVKEAIEEWNRMSAADKKDCNSFYVLKSANPDEEAENHFDGDYVWIAKE